MSIFCYIDLFAGAGGLSEGFIRAGFEPIAHVEIDEAACYTLKTRMAYHYLKSINTYDTYISYLKGEISRNDLYSFVPPGLLNTVINLPIGSDFNRVIHTKIEKQIQEKEVDLIIGGPPCQAYSLVGRARSANGMSGDPRNYLYVQYAKYLEKYNPKVFVFENVPGLKSAKDGLYLRNMKKLFLQKGYYMKLFTVEANNFGVLQKRKRIIIIGWKENLSFTIPDLETIKINAGSKVKSLFADLPKIQAGEGTDKFLNYRTKTNDYLNQSFIRNGIDILTQHIARPHTKQDKETYRIAVEKWNSNKERLNYNDLPERLKTHKNRTSFFDRFKVVAADELHSQTIVAHIAKDGHNFAHATLRCVGVGKCRREEGGTMCPSYMVTREEEHSTRGRARLLFEMIDGNVLKNGWKDEAVKDALDLCLACKGCKGECPVNADMATYKAEFLSHYYEGKLRPRSAYAFGLIYWWSRLASLMAGVANFFTQTPGISNLIKAIGGISQKRQMPKFAEYTFRDWFRNRKINPSQTRKQKVILWADTFNNFFKPETLVAGTHVLEAAGFEVIIPKQMLCCGRPLYDFGMLNTAKKLLREILISLREEIENGIPIVGLEPSCVAVFRDELTGLFPSDHDANRLQKQTFTLGEFLEKYAPDFAIPQLKQKAIMHGHCHHKAIMKTKNEKKLLRKTGLELHVLDSGCCGMAGYFGYEKGKHYDVSIAAGERVLLPAVRNASMDTVVVADGFSCREQIEQQTNRKGMHLAQVLQMAIEENGKEQSLMRPEKKYVNEKRLTNPHKTRDAILFTGVALLGFAIYKLVTSNQKSR